VEPINIVASSIPADGNVTSPLAEISIETDKEIKEVGEILLVSGDKKYILPSSTNGKTVTLLLPADLPRDANYKVVMSSVTGKNKESLPAVYETSFYLTPGPRVTGWSLGDRKAPKSGGFSLYFDQQLGKQDFSSKIKLYQDGNLLSYSVASRGSSLYLSLIHI